MDFPDPAGAMAKWVARRDVREGEVGEPLLCVDPRDMFASQASHTLEECVQKLLRADEVCLGQTNRRSIMKGARVVGYIEIVEASEATPEGS
jgi:hypothetical protein